jgi:hypothetical protein
LYFLQTQSQNFTDKGCIYRHTQYKYNRVLCTYIVVVLVAAVTTVFIVLQLAWSRDSIMFYVSVKALCTETEFPEDRFLDTYVTFHETKARGEALDTSTDGDVSFLQQCITFTNHAVSC